MTRNVLFTDEAWMQYVFWQTQDKKTLRRINQLLENARRSPFEGIGKPEPLKGNLTGLWSRRIDEVNRMVYQADDFTLSIVSCRYRYGDK